MAPQKARPNFDALRDLHDSANDLLLHSPVIKKAIAYNHGQQKWVHEISEASLRILESCGNTKEVLSLVKDHLQDLQSTFRRVLVGGAVGGRGGGDNTFEGFGIQRKKLKKAVLKRLESLKGMKNKKNKKCSVIFTSSREDDGDDRNNDGMFLNQELNVVVNVLREVRMTTMAIVESLVSLMSMPIITPNNIDGHDDGSKPNKLLLLGFFESKSSRNRVNTTLMMSSWEKCDAVVLQRANKRLEEVEMAIEELEEEVECIFRRLIRTRVSLLNILTN